MGGQHAFGDLDDPGVLPGNGLGEDRRHPPRDQLLAAFAQERRQRLHPRGRGLQPHVPRREIACRQRIERSGGDIVVDLRVPGPVLQLVVGPDPVFELVPEDRVVDLVIAAQRRRSDRVEPGQDRTPFGNPRGAARRGDIGQPGIVIVDSQRSRLDRGKRHGRGDEALSQRLEGGIGPGRADRRRRSLGRFERQRGKGQHRQRQRGDQGQFLHRYLPGTGNCPAG